MPAAEPKPTKLRGIASVIEPHCWSFSLGARWRALAFLAAVVLLSTWFIAQAVRFSLAATWGDSNSAAIVERAIAWDPSNPEWHYARGMIAFWDDNSPTSAVAEFRLATELAPKCARYWSELGNACFAAGDAACADQAVERASELAPANPEYSWQAALHFALTGDSKLAFVYLRRHLELEPRGARNALQTILHTTRTPEPMWQDLVSRLDPEAKITFLTVLAEDNQLELARSYWREMSASGARVSLAGAEPYLERLLSAGEYGQAVSVWRHLQKTEVIPSDEHKLVFNGDFQRQPLNAGFDWRLRPQPYVSIDVPHATEDSSALLIDYTVPDNSQSEPIFQYVPVVPGQHYLLTASMRSEAITSDSGPRLHVIDAACPSCLDVVSEGVTGSTPWHDAVLAFTAGPETQMVRISILRQRGRSFPMEISGRLLVRYVGLQAVEGSASVEAPQ